MKLILPSYLLIILFLVLTSCTGIPESIRPVNNFQLEKYLGTWYEIARLDHAFERGLTNIRATYSLREDGGIKVVNQGYSIEEDRWKTAEGKAYFVDEPTIGHLKVSFFGPFYGSYIVFELDQENYRYALVSGPNKSYFWLLARTKTIDEQLKQDLIAKAAALGFETNELIFVSHTENRHDLQ